MLTQLKPYLQSQLEQDTYPLFFLSCSAEQQIEIAHYIKSQSGLLITEWLYDNPQKKSTHWFTLYLHANSGIYYVESVLDKENPELRDLSTLYPVCNRLQRALHELYGVNTSNAKDTRLWLNHGNFPLNILRENNSKECLNTSYIFHRVSGQGVHEIPVGPVHAGIIEPGHFRFSVVGERVLKLEEKLGYTHKGTHKLLKNSSQEQAQKLIGRISGDSTVAYSIAYAHALEQIYAFKPQLISTMERQVCLERERISNHISDIGAIINDTGMPSLQASFTILKEQVLRHNKQYLGHRYFMDCITPFQRKKLFSTEQLQQMHYELSSLKKQLIPLQKIVQTHFGLQDRVSETGYVSKELAVKLGLLGMAAKASGINNDIRHHFSALEQTKSILQNLSDASGDVAARLNLRFQECFESIALIALYIEKINSASWIDTENNSNSLSSSNTSIGIGMVEGWRGPITVILGINKENIAWCHFHDPSWQNWLALEYAIENNIIADFPLINKSFNLSYSGHDS